MVSPPKADRLILVDGSGYIFRAYHALPPMTRADGVPVNAVYGFSNMLMKLMDDLLDKNETELIAIIFDAGRITFRNEIYPDYKANRDETPEDLLPQFDLIRDATRAFNVACIDMKGFEADDLIATYARLGKEQGLKVTVVSADKDLMQLVGDNVEMLDPMKQRVIGPHQVMEKFGVPPNKVIDVQALAGDSADNVPGVPGIGVKTAALLLNEYGDLETLLERASEIKQNKRRENLIEFADLARISKELVTLKDDVPVTTKLDDFGWQAPEPSVLLDWLKDQGFRSLATKVATELGTELGGGDAVASPAIQAAAMKEEAEYELVQDAKALDKWIERAFKAGTIAVDTETDALDAFRSNLVGVSISTEPGNGCYIPLGHTGSGVQGALDLGENGEATKEAPKQIPLKKAIAKLKPLLESPGVLKVGQNIKYDLHVLRRYGIGVTPVDDTMVLSYVLDGSSHGHGMDELANLHLGHKPIKFSEVCGKGKNQITFDQVPLETATDYAAEDADITLRLQQILKPRLVEDRLTAVYEGLDRALIPILVDMEAAGIKTDVGVLKAMSQDFASRAADLETEIHKLAGREFNVGSPKQLGEILFDEMSIEGGKKTGKSGAWATGADVLEDLAAQGHDLPAKVLGWRQVTKLKSTYTDALQNQINPNTGRVHTSYSQTVASTGRLSSNDPNLQNIPIRTEEGRKIRTAFIAEKGMSLVSADYSQIELRLVAHVANIKALKDAFKNGEDIHAATASKMFGVQIEGMDPMIRRQAKAINFGIIYGISAFGLARQLSIPRSEAKDFIDAYFEQFPEIRTYMDETKAIAKRQGYVTTMFGRRCQTPGIKDRNQNVRGFSERSAINAPIQGGAADIIKRAMIRLPYALADAGLSATMLLQVHDELIFEVPDKEIEDTITVVKKVMEGAAQLDVPLVADAGCGANWAEAH
ncbi:MAG: DNA polymerase I [Rhodospirillaceae bacterium]|nr:DNA polymerase I [Rhodospirillaceae bacterium]